MAKQRLPGILDHEPVQLGNAAPDFELPALIGGVRRSFRLGEYLGKAILLAFYPYNWQETSLQQMKGYQAARASVLAIDAEIVAVSVESIMNTTAWERQNGPLDFPLCSDFWPHGEVCARYGVLQESGADAGAGTRAVIVLNRECRIVFHKVYGWEEVPPLDEVFPLLEQS
jgi:peroxiredoxin